MAGLPRKYVLFKGVEGFADRLQCLLQVIDYAKKTGRILVLDWRDADWQHDPLDCLSNYFTLNGLECLPIHDFFERISSSLGLTVYPESWSSKIKTPDFSGFCRQDEYRLPGNSQSIEDICSGARHDFIGDIVVYAGVGQRYYRFNSARHIVLADGVKERIKGFSRRFSLYQHSYDVIHLRGGSKSWMGGFVADSSPVKDQHEQWLDVDAYLSPIWDTYQHLLSSDPVDKPLFLLSDTPLMIEEWKDRYGCGCPIPNSIPGILAESGIHKLDRSALSRVGKSINKSDLNYECLRDFVLMMNARYVVGDGVSLFSWMAFNLKENGVSWCDFPVWSF